MDTKERLLDAAERLFAERGFEGTSLRAVTHAAGTSVSAANYHFGSKEALLRETLRRRVEPLNRRRLELLAARERAAGGGALDVETVLDTFLRPIFETFPAGERAEICRRVTARLHSGPRALTASLKAELFGEVADRFLRALGRALPDRADEELALGFVFGIGVMAHTLSGSLEEAPPVAQRPALAALPDEVVLGRMVAFVAAGLRAGPPRAGGRP